MLETRGMAARLGELRAHMRALGLDAELTLRDAGSAFLDAFAKVEHESRQNGTELGPLTPDGLHALLQRAK